MSDRVPSDNPVLHIVQAAKEYVVGSEQDLQAIKALYTIYKAAVASVRTNIDQAFIRLPSASSPSNIFRLQDDIVKYGGELKELEYQYKATLCDKEEQRRSVLEKLCRNLVATLGLPLVESTVQDLSNREPSDRQGGSSRARRGRTRAESNQRPAPSAAEHEPTTGAAHPKISGGTASCKRTWDGVGPSNRHKRPRGGSIHFDQVFEDGQAQTKRIIVQHPKENGQWYILRCDEHDLDFGDKPVVSAGAHISSLQHEKLSRETAVVIEHFGTEVLGCDRVLAEKNNAVARAAFKMTRPGGQAISTGDGPSSTQPGGNQMQSRQGASSGGDRRSQRREPVVDPTPGDVYLGFWGKSKKSWAVLLLPTKSIGDVGVRGTIESLGLTGKVPGYEDGGALVARREFPVLYFDGRRKCRVGWLGARNLVPFDAESAAASNVPHIESVRKYLQRRARGVSADTAGSSVTGEGPGREESSPSPRADRHNPDGSPSYGSEASSAPQTDPSDWQCDTGSNLDTSTNDQFDQSLPEERHLHGDLPHSVGQVPVPEPTAEKPNAMSEERGPVSQQHDTDAPISTFVGRPDVINLVKIAQDAQQAAGLERRLSLAAQDVRGSCLAKPDTHVTSAYAN